MWISCTNRFFRLSARFVYNLHSCRGSECFFSVGRTGLGRKRADDKLLTSFLSEVLETTEYATAKKLRYYPDVTTKPLETIKETLKALQELGIHRSDVADNLEILALNKPVVQHRYMSLKEFGFNSIKAPEILWYDHIMSSSRSDLNAQSVMPKTCDPIAKLLTALNAVWQLELAIMDQCTDADMMPLQKLKECFLRNLLSFYLGFEERITQDMINASRDLAKSCVASVREALEIYRREFSLSPDMFRRHPGILAVLPENLTALLDIGEKYQVDIRDIASRLPIVLRIAPESFSSICRSLVDYGICAGHISMVPRVLLSSPEYVSTALATLSTWPEFHILKARPTFLSVLLAYKRANLHMEYLKKAGFERCSLKLLLSSDEEFKKHLCRGEETETCKEIAAYLAERLECSVSEAFNSLQYHPSFSKTSVTTVKTTLAYLFKTGFSREQIRHGLAIVLYPKSKVIRNWRLLPQLDIAQPFSRWKGDPNLVQLLLYVVEKGEYIFLKPVNVPTLLQVPG